MFKKRVNIAKIGYPFLTLTIIVLLWQLLYSQKIVPPFMLPSPWQVVRALINAFPLLIEHSKISLIEALLGLSISVVLAFVIALFMDWFEFLRQMMYPLLIITQTIPVVAIAPLLVLWFGYGIAPKVLLIVIVCFFPLAVGLFSGFKAVDSEIIDLLRSMGATKLQIFYHVKFPTALPYFFSSLKIATSYSVIGAVIAEWLGGTAGLGVYMIRVRNAYAFDQMFSVIVLISIISLLLIQLVTMLEKKAMPWANKKNLGADK